MSVVRPAPSLPLCRPAETDRQARGGPATLRANPCPEVTDPSCRLPLPTLFHRPEASHLGDLLRSWVRPTRRAMPDAPPAKGGRRAGTSGFSRVVGSAPDAAPTAALCRSVGPLAGWTASRPDATPSTRDDNSRRGSRRRLRWPESESSPTRDRLGAVGSGISTRFPFTPTPPHGHAGFRIDSPACDCR